MKETVTFHTALDNSIEVFIFDNGVLLDSFILNIDKIKDNLNN